MERKLEKLKTLDNEKLIDVVKNYKQYGYDRTIREFAISILKERGIDEEYLKMTGNFTNQNYDSAENSYSSFINNSKKALISFVLIILLNALISIFEYESESMSLILSIILIISIVVYLIFLIKSFINQSKFYKSIGEEYRNEGIIIYFLLGIPFYLIMYFNIKKQMKEKLTMGI